ncbi:unnamed protein product [Durusdinium trenchii]|uniref:Uncharacterized protein n=1 Tax=Durusdinium trenchii TaxID=1381693 RepID=A0ABP0K2D8_9DINO
MQILHCPCGFELGDIKPCLPGDLLWSGDQALPALPTGHNITLWRYHMHVQHALAAWCPLFSWQHYFLLVGHHCPQSLKHNTAEQQQSPNTFLKCFRVMSFN